MMHTETGNTHLHTINALLTVALTAAVALFVLALAIKVGFDVIQVLAPTQAEAAPVITATPYPTTAPTDVLPTPTAVQPTPAPPTPTQEPTPVPPTPTPAVPRLIAGDHGVNVRVGPSTVFEKIGYLEPGTDVTILGQSHGWWQIAYPGVPAGERAFVFGEIVTAYDAGAVPGVTPPEVPSPTLDEPVFQPAPVWAIDEERWIDVDLSEQRVTAYEGQTPVQSYLVSTGLPQTPTPEGQFRIWIKLRTDDMEGEDYFLEDVPFVMYFHQGYGFHGVWWHANWGHPMSHGCVNQPNEMAE